MSKDVHFNHPKFTFLKFGIQFVFFQPLEHLSNLFHMLLHKVVIDQTVVYVYDHEVMKPFPENVIHENAKCVLGALVSPNNIVTNLYEPYLVR
jgi:hypothetical protein